ncbi:MAG TPA: nitroreductase family deazaflavin-dependent oxidoreductase [Ktedonobacterales bacterium]|jgi:deazaflavin-dependent oxidoreductase (nitroreductase family)
MAAKKMRMSYFTVFAHALTGGRAYAGDENSPAGFLKLTTIGRKSGQSRTVELLYMRDGPRYVVTASNAGKARNPGWYFNAQSNPQVILHVHGRDVPALAQIASPEQRSVLWAKLIEIAPFYGGYERRMTREIPMVLLTPLATPAS